MKLNKIFWLMFACLFFPSFTAAQDLANNSGADNVGWAKPSSVYVSPDGKTYVRSKEPIYLHLSTSPDNDAPTYLLRNIMSHDPKKPIQPFYFEGHGTHTILHPPDHKVPQNRKNAHKFYVYDDGSPPETSMSITNAPRAVNGETVVFGQPVTITLDAYDQDSGAHSIYYCVDLDSWQEYMTTINFEKEKDYKLRYYAVDNVGNKSKINTHYFALDFTPPTTNHTVEREHFGDILSPKSLIVLNGEDIEAGIDQILYQFSVEKAKNKQYENTPLTMKGLGNGEHTLIYASIDRVKNVEPSVTYSFYLDRIPPIVSYHLSGDFYAKGKQTYVSSRSAVELTASDNKAGVKEIYFYQDSDKKGTSYTEQFSFPERNGKSVFAYTASDAVGNTSRKETHEVIVDITPPSIRPEFKGAHYFSRNVDYIRRTTELAFSTSDNLSGTKSLAYSLDQTDENYNNNIPFSISTEGYHTIRYYAVDNVNNRTKDKDMILFVDEIQPEVFHHFSVQSNVRNEEIYPLNAFLYLAATDKESGIRKITYQVNNGTVFNYKSAILFNQSGKFTVHVQALDNLGNVSAKNIKFQIQKSR